MATKYFSKPEQFRKWLDKNHDRQEELWVGFYKKGTGISSITWPESVEQALCYGWIDGIRKSIDEQSYKIRFTPRKPTSHWSKVNINKVKELKKRGLMMPSGLQAFRKMQKDNSELASYEQKRIVMPKAYLSVLKENPGAWKYYQQETPSYRKQSTWWIISAKQEKTRLKRLHELIDNSHRGIRIKPLRRPELASKN